MAAAMSKPSTIIHLCSSLCIRCQIFLTPQPPFWTALIDEPPPVFGKPLHTAPSCIRGCVNPPWYYQEQGNGLSKHA